MGLIWQEHKTYLHMVSSRSVVNSVRTAILPGDPRAGTVIWTVGSCLQKGWIESHGREQQKRLGSLHTTLFYDCDARLRLMAPENSPPQQEVSPPQQGISLPQQEVSQKQRER